MLLIKMDFSQKKVLVFKSEADGKYIYSMTIITDKKEYGKKANVLSPDGDLKMVLLDYSYNNEDVFSYTCPITDGTIYISGDNIEKSPSASNIVDIPYYSKEQMEEIAKNFIKMKYFPTLPKECIC